MNTRAQFDLTIVCKNELKRNGKNNRRFWKDVRTLHNIRSSLTSSRGEGDDIKIHPKKITRSVVRKIRKKEEMEKKEREAVEILLSINIMYKG